MWETVKKQKILILVGIWLLAVGSGLALLLDHAYRSGALAPAPLDWPSDSSLKLSSERATLVLFGHPQCPCTRATVSELSRLIAQAPNRLQTYVLFVKPEEMPSDWAHSDIWQSSSAINGVTVAEDKNGMEAKRFKATTSGQVVLYDPQGKLIFRGGITKARGHEGDNDGRDAIFSYLTTGVATTSSTPVFGCALFASEEIKK